MKIERAVTLVCAALLLSIFGWYEATAQTIPTCGQCTSQTQTYLVNQNFKQGFTADGGTFTNTIVSAMNDGGVTLKTTALTQPMRFVSGQANSSTATPFIFDTSQTMITAGAKLMSVANGGAEKFSVGLDGTTTLGLGVSLCWSGTSACLAYNGANVVALTGSTGLTANSFTANNGVTGDFASAQANGATAKGVIARTTTTYSTAGAQLFTVRNGLSTTDLFAITKDGKPLTTFTDTSGTPGNGTANTTCGRSAIASTASAAVITNSLVSATSNVFAQVETSGAGVSTLAIVPAAGSFTASSMGGAGVVSVTTATFKFSWCVYN